jgi:hypothetical protein
MRIPKPLPFSSTLNMGKVIFGPDGKTGFTGAALNSYDSTKA